MHDLQLVGFTTDRRGLIFRTRAGARAESYVVPVTEELIEAVAELAGVADRPVGRPVRAEMADAPMRSTPEPEPEPAEPPPAPTEPEPVRDRADGRRSQLSVRDIQARLRVGEEISRIAAEAGVDEEWIERFAPPVRAEQRRVIDHALDSRLRRSRNGLSAVPLREAVGRAMADRGIAFTVPAFDAAWSARLVGHDRWAVEFAYRHRGRRRTATWDYDVSADVLTTSDRSASQLGFVADDEDAADRPMAREGVIGASDVTPVGLAPDDQRSHVGPAPRPRRRAAPAPAPDPVEGDDGADAAAEDRAGQTAPATPARKAARPKKTAGKKAAAKKAAARPKKASRKRKPAAKKASPTEKRSPAKKTVAKKAAAKRKAPAKKRSPAKKARQKKAAAKKAVAKRTVAAEKRAGETSSTVGKKAARRPPAAKKKVATKKRVVAKTAAAETTAETAETSAPENAAARATAPKASPVPKAQGRKRPVPTTEATGPGSPAPAAPPAAAPPSASSPAPARPPTPTSGDAARARPEAPAPIAPPADRPPATVSEPTPRRAPTAVPLPDGPVRRRRRPVAADAPRSPDPRGEARSDRGPATGTTDAAGGPSPRPAPTVQFRSSSAAPIRLAGQSRPAPAPPVNGRPPADEPTSAPDDGPTPPAGASTAAPRPPAGVNGAPRPRRRRQLRAR